MSVFCGIDWAEQHHDVALVDATGQLIAKARIPDDAAGYRQLLDLLAEHGDTEAEPMPVAIETSRGLLVAVLRTGARQVSSGVEFPHSCRHCGLTDTGGTGDRSDPAVAEGLGFRPYQQATLPLVEVRQNRPELGCQHGPLPFQPAHARPTNHRAESHELKICTP